MAEISALLKIGQTCRCLARTDEQRSRRRDTAPAPKGLKTIARKQLRAIYAAMRCKVLRLVDGRQHKKIPGSLGLR